MKKLLVTALVLGLGSSAAFAQAPATDFATIDADKDGAVTLTEAQVVWPQLTEDAFKAADTNTDSKVDQAEYEAFLAANPPA